MYKYGINRLLITQGVPVDREIYDHINSQLLIVLSPVNYDNYLQNIDNRCWANYNKCHRPSKILESK